MRRAARTAGAAFVTGLVTGTVVVGLGGRLVMRLLGATAGAAAQGRLTEANEVVGEVTVGGTLALVVFVGLPFGLLTAIGWFLVRRFLPPGWRGGLVYGAGLLVVGATRNDPLRPDNRDFDLLGPWWLAVLAFSALALLQGIAVAGVGGRLAPAPDRRPVRWGGIVLAVAVLVALPGFVLDLADIVGRGS